MGTRSGLYRWADQGIEGGIANKLRIWRSEGLTLDQIVDELRGLDYPVSRETVRRWLVDLNIPKPAPESEAATS